ncbi:MAG: DUF3500 domain-containing protein [Verrucomicrobia bacterium]|nr:DUF3500 domain-containing protein [Verrucomicrobiota bacterium]
MKPVSSPSSCPSCDGLSRRDFLRTTVAGVAAAASGSLPLLSASAEPVARKSGPSETLVTTLYKSLTEEQRKVVAFSFDHPLRSKVDNNWQITDKTITEFYTPDQQAMIREIFLGLHSPEYAQRVMRQVEHDGGKEGFGGCAIALFGEPGTGKFEFVLSGRHVTRRCDGDSVEGEAFGGPIFYGHAAQGFNEKPDHPGNIYWYQALRANEVFKMLDGKQREQALLGDGPAEQGTDTVKLPGRADGLPGIPVSELSRDQKDHVRLVLADLLAPFRKADADEALKLIEANGFDKLSLAFYKNQDIGHDGVWDVWQIEGPEMLWYFRGAPHVHTWVHVRARA